MAIGTAAAILGSAVIGGAVASRGASKAARAQQQAAQTAAATEERMLERQLAETAPFRQLSLEQLNRLAALYALMLLLPPAKPPHAHRYAQAVPMPMIFCGVCCRCVLLSCQPP